MKSMTFLYMAGALALATPALAEDFAWRGRLTSGQTLEVRGINGGITADASGGDAEVTAVKRARNSDPASVRSRPSSMPAGSPSAPSIPARSGGRGQRLRAGRRTRATTTCRWSSR